MRQTEERYKQTLDKKERNGRLKWLKTFLTKNENDDLSHLKKSNLFLKMMTI
jgi:hypothetical protein